MEIEERHDMTAKRGTGIIIVAMTLFLVFGCGRPPQKSDFELGEEYFRAAAYKDAMMKLETWLKENPNDEQGHNTKAHVMLAVMYHDDETRQKLFETKFKILQGMGEPGMAAVLKLIEEPTIASRLGNTINDILVKGGELSVPPLMQNMKSPNQRLRIYARDVFVQLGEPAVASLIELLNDPDLYNRSRAIEVLSKIGDKKAIKPLEAKLSDSSGLVRIQAAAALYGMGQENTTKKVILDALKSEDVQAKRVAIKAVAESVDDPPLKPMLELMKDADADVRNYAAQAIGKTRSAEAVPPLVKILQEDENQQVRASAAGSLEKLGKSAVEPLIKVLEGTEDMELTIRIVQILGNLGDKKAIKPLEKVYKETSNAVLKNETAKALNKI